MRAIYDSPEDHFGEGKKEKGRGSGKGGGREVKEREGDGGSERDKQRQIKSVRKGEIERDTESKRHTGR